MQGFNMGRHRPYDSDPRTESFNARAGKHPLGDRARKLDQGVLIVRFELPFNVWCGGCEAHIGQGVRYNAEKRKVGSYLSTPIWAFRCKCHLCSHWFEIRTDPQHTRYVVHEGARQQVQEWDAEANGSWSIELGKDKGEGSSKDAPQDAFAALEKKETEQTTAKRNADRLQELEEHNERWSDPYSLNAKLRKRLRSDKRVAIRQAEADAAVRQRIGWHEDKPLQAVDPDLVKSAQDQFRAGREDAEAGRMARAAVGQSLTPRRSVHGEARAPRSKGKAPANGSATQQLAARLAANSRKKGDPFLQQVRSALGR